MRDVHGKYGAFWKLLAVCCMAWCAGAAPARARDYCVAPGGSDGNPGTLDAPWHGYVDFHLHKLGCRFCLANLHDLQEQTSQGASSALRDRILRSTIGFLLKSNPRAPCNGQA